MRKTRLLANWQPSALEREAIALNFAVFLGSKGFLALGIPEVFSPDDYDSSDDLSSMKWHQDNGVQEGLLAVWANIYPTEVRFGNGRRLRSCDGDVILIENDRVAHRMPPYVRKSDGRWFARTLVKDVAAEHRQRQQSRKSSPSQASVETKPLLRSGSQKGELNDA